MYLAQKVTGSNVHVSSGPAAKNCVAAALQLNSKKSAEHMLAGP